MYKTELYIYISIYWSLCIFLILLVAFFRTIYIHESLFIIEFYYHQVALLKAV